MVNTLFIVYILLHVIVFVGSSDFFFYPELEEAEKIQLCRYLFRFLYCYIDLQNAFSVGTVPKIDWIFIWFYALTGDENYKRWCLRSQLNSQPTTNNKVKCIRRCIQGQLVPFIWLERLSCVGLYC